MTISQSAQQQIAELLQQESALCSALKTALNDERAALEKRDFDAFNQTVQVKQQCATNLEGVEKNLFQLLADAGFSESRNGFNRLLEILPSDRDQFGIHGLWNKLQNDMIDCQKQNQINGQIINVSMVNTQQALNILSGRDLHTSTYDQAGKTGSKDDNQKIAIA